MTRRCVTHGDSGQCSIDGPAGSKQGMACTRGARARARANMVQGDSQSDRRETGPDGIIGTPFHAGAGE